VNTDHNWALEYYW